MKFVLLIAYFLAHPSYDGGVAVHTQKVEFGTMRRCEAAAAKVRGPLVVGRNAERPFVLVTATCIEAY